MQEVLTQLQQTSSHSSISKLSCFGLGQLSTVISKYQTAFLLLIKESLRIEDFRSTVFDPIFSDEEKQVLEKLGFFVEEKNKKCKIRLENKTLVFLPHCPKELTNNLLYANLKSTIQNGASLHNLVLISNSLSSVLLRTPAYKVEKSANVIKFVSEAGLVTETKICNSFKFNDIFNDMSLHTFTNPSPADLLHHVAEPVYDDDHHSELL